MDIDDRLRLNALLDRVLAPGETFDPDEARELIRLAPSTNGHPGFRVVNRPGGGGPGVRGHAPGIGDVEMRERGRRESTYHWGAQPERVGGYKFTHKPGTILIEMMWAHTRLDASGQYAVLRYDPGTGEPRRIDVSVPLNLRLYYWWRRALTLCFVTFRPWKTPARGGGTAVPA